MEKSGSVLLWILLLRGLLRSICLSRQSALKAFALCCQPRILPDTRIIPLGLLQRLLGGFSR
jgi:hypothetical protein